MTRATRSESRSQIRAHEYVADQLRREIGLHLVHAGESLPPERELARMFRVGRPTVQQAIAHLVADGLVEKRRGRSGGTFVLDTAADRRRMGPFFRRIRRDRSAILEALSYRLELEPGTVAQACRARTNGDIQRIARASRLVEGSTTETQMMKHDTAFHLAVAAATHNRLFQQSTEQIRMTLNDAIWVLPGSDLWMERTRREHRAIQRAIESGDAKAGRRAALAHIRHTDQSIRALLASI